MNQTQDNTNRVVGTYGYMAPEYALHGIFSERSEAWKRWMEGRGLELIDPLIRGTCSNADQQAVKCINVGLLCIQEIMSDIPTMLEVVVMLVNETATILSPKKPAFTLHRSAHVSSRFSNNEVIVTNLEPR
ncbi:hypothetical protein Lser_V15G11249 [Lactuca serriola]